MTKYESTDSELKKPIICGKVDDNKKPCEGLEMLQEGQDSSEDERNRIQQLLKQYARNSSMHGIPTIVGSRLYRGRSIFWTLVVGMMAVALAFVIFWQITDFYGYPTVTKVEIRKIREGDFPSLTFCNLNIFDNEFLKQLGSDAMRLMAQINEHPFIYNTFGKATLDNRFGKLDESKMSRELLDGKDLAKWVTNLTKPIEQTLPCSFGDHFWDDCKEFFHPVITELGICYTMNPSSIENSTDNEGRMISNSMRGFRLFLTTNKADIPYRLYQFNGIRVVLHDPGTVPLPAAQGFIVNSNCFADVRVDKTVRSGLGPPYLAFGDSECADTENEDFVSPLSRFPRYTREACESECFMNFTVKMCGGCRHFLHPGPEPVCPLPTLVKCFRAAELEYYGGRNDVGCRCVQPCKSTSYGSSVTCAHLRETAFFKESFTQSMMDIVELNVHFASPIVNEIEQVPVYTLESLLGSLGGQISLFLGFSLISIIEMMEFLFIIVTNCNTLRKGRKGTAV